MAGFTKEEVANLVRIHRDLLRLFTYRTDLETHGLADYWEDDQVLLPTVLHNVPFTGDCEEFAMVSLHRAMDLGFDARLVIGWTETHEGHCLCEVVSRDMTQAYYLDNRKLGLVTRSGLPGYTFYSASPYNPQKGDTRPWVLLDASKA